MIRIFPDLDEDLLIRLFHKGARFTWTSADVDWEAPWQLDRQQARSLARLLTPVYLGEQSAMIGASAIMPQLMNAGETTAQVYLASFIFDEARHFEALTHLYRRLEVTPAGIREVPEMLRYHHRLRQGDRADWVWGILISDLFAKQFYGMFAKSQPEALFGQMSGRILRDESRHQAFADEYLRRAIPSMSDARRLQLVSLRDDLMATMEAMYGRLNDDAVALSIDGRAFLDRLMADVDTHARRIGLTPGPGDDPGGRPSGNGRSATVSLAERRSRQASSGPTPSAQASATHSGAGATASANEACDDACGTCYLAALCASRLVTRATAG